MEGMYEGFLSAERCVEATGKSKYHVAVLVAKRARELSSGAVAVVDKENKKPIAIALEELVSGELGLAELENRFVVELKSSMREKLDQGGGHKSAHRSHEDGGVDDKFGVAKFMNGLGKELEGVVRFPDDGDHGAEELGPVSYSSEEIEE